MSRLPEVRFDLDPAGESKRWVQQWRAPDFWRTWVLLVRKWAGAAPGCAPLPVRHELRLQATRSWGPYGGWRWTTKRTAGRSCGA